jgi:very-short-patch-repair endonuclease
MAARAWALVAAQHGVIARWQLREIGYGKEAIRHRIDTGRLRPVFRGVFAVGRPDLTPEALLMAAALSFGPAAFVSHFSAGLLWGIWRDLSRAIHVSTKSIHRKRDGLVPHQRKGIIPVRCKGIPTTDVVDTITDMALLLDRGPLETLVNNADKRNLIDPEALRAALDRRTRRPGIGKLKAVLDRATFIYTDSDLEKALLPLARRAGLRKPESQVNLGAGRTDFYFPGLVVECDGLRYHRTAFTQNKDLVRNNAHMLQSAITLRFSHAQINYEPDYVVATLSATRRPPAAAHP